MAADGTRGERDRETKGQNWRRSKRGFAAEASRSFRCGGTRACAIICSRTAFISPLKATRLSRPECFRPLSALSADGAKLNLRQHPDCPNPDKRVEQAVISFDTWDAGACPRLG